MALFAPLNEVRRLLSSWSEGLDVNMDLGEPWRLALGELYRVFLESRRKGGDAELLRLGRDHCSAEPVERDLA